ncbi:MAG: tetratricopeptide repeat protein [Candidatus Obscuribacter sp.]|nr:tetratricopeptide repeat protein [Candidatus Melainabacteria bacterium]MDX1988442.1 tetratricopeptide repeat protein [Candidatus Obscuribacter sp.]
MEKEEGGTVLTLDKRLELEAAWLKYTEEGHKAHADRRYAFGEIKFIAALKAAEALAEGLHSSQVVSALNPADPEEKARQRQDLERLSKGLNNLAALYQLQGKYQMAEELYERCLDLKLDLYGEEHLDTAVNLHNLATLHCAKRRFEKAEILFKRALEIREKLLGHDDEQLLPILKNYAALLRKLEREEEAVRLEERIATLER